MSFFTNSSGIIITGGIFMSNSLPTQDAAGGTQVLGERKECEPDDYALADELRKKRPSRCSSLDGLMIVKADEVDLHRELIRGIGYRIHSASHHGRLVVVKAFEGPRAKQDWTVDVAFSKEFLHSNVLKIAGVSDELERPKNPFVLFRGITSEQKMQSLIAKALRTDLNMSVQISMKAVKGIAAGLSYIKSQNIPMYPGTMNNLNIQNWENFNIFTGYDDEPIISFHPSSTVRENGSVSQTFDDEIDGRGVEVLSGVCRQLFSRANSILYDDSPEREFDVYDSEGFPRAPDSDMSNPSNSTEKPKSSRTPRREVWWHDLGAKNRSLESIKQRFEDCLDRFLTSSSNSLLRHITSPMDSRLRHNLHQCPGYLREEITLVSDASKSVIVSHAFPSQSEVCSICGQLVQYKYNEPSIVDIEIQEAPDDRTQIREHTANNRSEQHAQLPRLRELVTDPLSSTQTYPSPTSLQLSTEGAPLIQNPTLHSHPESDADADRVATMKVAENADGFTMPLWRPDNLSIGKSRLESSRVNKNELRASRRPYDDEDNWEMVPSNLIQRHTDEPERLSPTIWSPARSPGISRPQITSPYSRRNQDIINNPPTRAHPTTLSGGQEIRITTQTRPVWLPLKHNIFVTWKGEVGNRRASPAPTSVPSSGKRLRKNATKSMDNLKNLPSSRRNLPITRPPPPPPTPAGAVREYTPSLIT